MVILIKATKLVYPTVFSELEHLLGVFPNQKHIGWKMKDTSPTTHQTPLFRSLEFLNRQTGWDFLSLLNAIGMLSRGHVPIELLQWYCGIFELWSIESFFWYLWDLQPARKFDSVKLILLGFCCSCHVPSCSSSSSSSSSDFWLVGWFGLGWIGLVWVGLGWVGLVWFGWLVGWLVGAVIVKRVPQMSISPKCPFFVGAVPEERPICPRVSFSNFLGCLRPCTVDFFNALRLGQVL